MAVFVAGNATRDMNLRDLRNLSVKLFQEETKWTGSEVILLVKVG